MEKHWLEEEKDSSTMKETATDFALALHENVGADQVSITFDNEGEPETVLCVVTVHEEDARSVSFYEGDSEDAFFQMIKNATMKVRKK